MPRDTGSRQSEFLQRSELTINIRASRRRRMFVGDLCDITDVVMVRRTEEEGGSHRISSTGDGEFPADPVRARATTERGVRRAIARMIAGRELYGYYGRRLMAPANLTA